MTISMQIVKLLAERRFSIMTNNIPNVAEKLRFAAKTHEARTELYGNTWTSTGEIFKALFPNGINVHTADDMNRLNHLTLIIGKIGRYCARFDQGGHEDSLHDISVLAQMLSYLDQMKAERVFLGEQEESIDDDDDYDGF